MDPTLQWVATYRAIGWATVRLPPMGKAPTGPDATGWPKTDYPVESFAPHDNIGIKLGTPSQGLIDVDLDCPEAAALAPLFLTRTVCFGRTGAGKTPGRVVDWSIAPRSRHYLYRCATKTKKPSQSHIEIRSTGLQTMFPGSIHPSGEPIEWTSNEPVADVTEPELHRMVGRLAFATILARAWCGLGGVKHSAVLALAGALWHAGWTEEDASSVLLPPMMLDGSTGGEHAHREQAIRSTWDETDKMRIGWPTVTELLGQVDAKALKSASEMVATVSKHDAVKVGGVIIDLHDVGNAERFMVHAGGDFRHVKGLGWMAWDGSTWVQNHPTTAIISSVRALQKLGEDTRDPAILKWAQHSYSRDRIGAIETLASKVDTRTSSLDLDAQHWLLNCRNGTVDLRTGELLEHDRSWLITRSTGVEYDPSASAPRFVQFLLEVFAGDQALIAYMLRYLGYALTGSTNEQIFQVWHGHGANGKSTLIELMIHVLGDYAQRMAEDLLIAKRTGRDSGAPSPDVARMRGARFVVGAEVGEGLRWNEPLVKQLTGGDRVVARHLQREMMEFDPTWKIALAVNHKPIVRGTDHGIWRRIHLVPFEVTFSGGGLDPDLLATLKSEATGVLALLVRGCLEWQRSGLTPPRRVRAAVEEYKGEHDVVGTFLAECTKRNDRACVTKQTLYRVFRSWATANGEFVYSRSAFHRILSERGLIESTDTQGWAELAVLEGGF